MGILDYFMTMHKGAASTLFKDGGEVKDDRIKNNVIYKYSK